MPASSRPKPQKTPNKIAGTAAVMLMKSVAAEAKRLVVKVGSSLVTNEGQGLDHAALARWAEQIAELRHRKKQVVLVSSGAVAEGMKRLGWKRRPHALHEQQAAAAVGQMGLVEAYESCFRKHGMHTAQVLLTHEDLSHRKRYLNARSTLRTLLGLNVIPIINENDTVATDEIRFGDNDTLAALVTNLIEADALVILTDQPGLYTKDPRRHQDAELDQRGQGRRSRPGKNGGRRRQPHRQRRHAHQGACGRRAARSGAATIIASGREPDVLVRLAGGEAIGTQLIADTMTLAARKQWLADHLQVRGKLTLDDGAVRALKVDGKSLLPIGVYELSGRIRARRSGELPRSARQRDRPRAGELQLGGDPPDPQVAQPAKSKRASAIRR